MSFPADTNFPALSAAIIKPRSNKLTSASARAATPVVAYSYPFVVLSKFSVLLRSVTVLPSAYDTDDRLEFIVYSKLMYYCG